MTRGPRGDVAVSVIVPARDAAPTVEATLRGLQGQRFSGRIEVVVVDDGSVDGTGAIIQKYASKVTVIHNRRSEGPGAARNRGVAVSSGEILAFTDADCVPTPGWVAAGVESIADVDLVQGRVEPDPIVRRTPFDRTLRVDGHRGFYQTANLFVRRAVFERVGGFRDWALEAQRGRRWSVDRRRGGCMRTPIGEDTVFAWCALRDGARSAFARDALVHHAVVPGGLRDEVEDRWHWARDMPALVKLVPELRDGTLYRRWWFNHWTAQFDLAAAAVALGALTQRWLWLMGVMPYAWRQIVECRRYPRREALAFLFGSPMVELTTLAGLIRGSVASRCLVI
jgi:glycosyltransferase involved in cell wall biosynthesis